VDGFVSEWWPASHWNAWPDCVCNRSGRQRRNLSRALASTKIARLLEVALLPPNQRTPFEPLVASWAAAIKTDLQRIIDGKMPLPLGNGGDPDGDIEVE
jgi:hypothetical protein